MQLWLVLEEKIFVQSIRGNFRLSFSTNVNDSVQSIGVTPFLICSTTPFSHNSHQEKTILSLDACLKVSQKLPGRMCLKQLDLTL